MYQEEYTTNDHVYSGLISCLTFLSAIKVVSKFPE